MHCLSVYSLYAGLLPLRPSLPAASGLDISVLSSMSSLDLADEALLTSAKIPVVASSAGPLTAGAPAYMPRAGYNSPWGFARPGLMTTMF